MPTVTATASGCNYRRCRSESEYVTGDGVVASHSIRAPTQRVRGGPPSAVPRGCSRRRNRRLGSQRPASGVTRAAIGRAARGRPLQNGRPSAGRRRCARDGALLGRSAGDATLYRPFLEGPPPSVARRPVRPTAGLLARSASCSTRSGAPAARFVRGGVRSGRCETSRLFRRRSAKRLSGCLTLLGFAGIMVPDESVKLS